MMLFKIKCIKGGVPFYNLSAHQMGRTALLTDLCGLQSSHQMATDVSYFTLFNFLFSGLTLRFHSEVVEEGTRVKLTCGTACPLPTNTTYIWSQNKKVLPQSQGKHLVLDPVSRKHNGSYSCTVKINFKRNISSSERTLNVLCPGEKKVAAGVGAGATLLVTIPLIVFFWFRWATG